MYLSSHELLGMPLDQHLFYIVNFLPNHPSAYPLSYVHILIVSLLPHYTSILYTYLVYTLNFITPCAVGGNILLPINLCFIKSSNLSNRCKKSVMPMYWITYINTVFVLYNACLTCTTYTQSYLVHYDMKYVHQGFHQVQYQGGVKSTVAGVFEDLKIKFQKATLRKPTRQRQENFNLACSLLKF